MAAPHTPRRLHVFADPNPAPSRIPLGMRTATLALAAVLAVAGCGGASSGAGPEPAAERPREACPEDWPGPWTACPEAAWVVAVVDRAGYAVTGETGSAFTAEGGGAAFFIWATPEAGSDAELTGPDQWQPVGRSAGVTVYGDDVWRWWRSQGWVLWMQAGPTEDARLPTRKELAPLIRAARKLAAPPAK
jgi:hypothetical protein